PRQHVDRATAAVAEVRAVEPATDAAELDEVTAERLLADAQGVAIRLEERGIAAVVLRTPDALVAGEDRVCGGGTRVVDQRHVEERALRAEDERSADPVPPGRVVAAARSVH